MSKLQLIATSAFGIEAVVARELQHLGYNDQMVENGRVTFSGDFDAIAKTNLWLRTSDRVLLKIGEFKALTFDELFEQTKALPWEEWIPEKAEFPVTGKSVNSKLASVSDCQAIVKKAIVERLKQKYNVQWFEETGPKYTIEVSMLKDTAILTIDTSGMGLHKRGYRKLVSGAPLKETLACAMLMVSRWKGDRILLDPCCGSGTIPIEAALIAKNIAPGLTREFDADKWSTIPANVWKNAREEARASIKEGEINIQGSDIDEQVISLARYHAKMAGVEKDIHLQQRPMNEISSSNQYGFIITNPPYGERLEEATSVVKLYKEMGTVFNKFDTWSFYVLTSYQDFETCFGKQADKKRKLYNGKIQCNYYQFYGPPPKRK